MQQTKILVVDDERNLNQLIATNLMLEGFDVAAAYSGAEALSQWATVSPDLVVLDVMMPDMDGFEVLRQIRLTSTVPVIMLTARSRTEEKVQGLQLGADDYLAKPFSFAELLARIEAILRRTQRQDHVTPAVTEILQFGTITCDLGEHRCMVAGHEVVLQNLEFKLLCEFLRAPGRVLTHDYLLMTVWPQGEGDVTTLRVAVMKLRNKINKATAQDELIETVHGLGYRLKTSFSPTEC